MPAVGRRLLDRAAGQRDRRCSPRSCAGPLNGGGRARRCRATSTSRRSPACVWLSTTVPPVGSVASSAVARATSAGLSGVTSTAARPSAEQLGLRSARRRSRGSSAMNSAPARIEVAAKASETSAAVMPGSSRCSSARFWAADMTGSCRVTVAVELAQHLARRAGRLALHGLLGVGDQDRLRASCDLALAEAVQARALERGAEVGQHGAPGAGPARGVDRGHAHRARPVRRRTRSASRKRRSPAAISRAHPPVERPGADAAPPARAATGATVVAGLARRIQPHDRHLGARQLGIGRDDGPRPGGGLDPHVARRRAGHGGAAAEVLRDDVDHHAPGRRRPPRSRSCCSARTSASSSRRKSSRPDRLDRRLGADGQPAAERRLGRQPRVDLVLDPLPRARAGALLLEDDLPLAVDLRRRARLSRMATSDMNSIALVDDVAARRPAARADTWSGRSW